MLVVVHSRRRLEKKGARIKWQDRPKDNHVQGLNMSTISTERGCSGAQIFPVRLGLWALARDGSVDRVDGQLYLDLGRLVVVC